VGGHHISGVPVAVYTGVFWVIKGVEVWYCEVTYYYLFFGIRFCKLF
jgi:hypothetical protein